MSETRRKQRRRVVSEDAFTSTLSTIVQRDYFPDLLELQKKVSVSSRRAAGDFAGAVAVRRAARLLEKFEEKCAQQEENDEINVDSKRMRLAPRPLHRETLTGFHARVTSEDNHDFEETQRREIIENRERLKDIFSQKYRTIKNAQLEVDPTPVLASDQFVGTQHRIDAPKNTSLGNSLFFAPDHSRNYNDHVLNKSSLNLENGSTSDDAMDMRLMPPPSRKPKTGLFSSFIAKHELVEFIPKQIVEKRIDPSQTRFTTVINFPPSAFPFNGGDSSSTDYSTEASTDLDGVSAPLSVERCAKTKRQKRDLQSLVAMTPTIVPGRGGEPASPITTWGTVCSTPIILAGIDTGMSFNLPDESSRDKVARVAEAKLVRQKNAAKASVASTKLGLNHVTALTPAANALLAKMTPAGSSSARSGRAFGCALRLSYTPNLRSQQSYHVDHVGKVTPISSSNVGVLVSTSIEIVKETSKTGGNLTDGLLKFE